MFRDPKAPQFKGFQYVGSDYYGSKDNETHLNHVYTSINSKQRYRFMRIHDRMPCSFNNGFGQEYVKWLEDNFPESACIIDNDLMI